MASRKKTSPSGNIDLENPEFKTLKTLLEHTSQSIFLTGKAGTGKSTFLRHIIATTRKKCVVLAPTGIAAVNVGAQTIHSFFRMPLKPLLPDDPDFAVHRLRQRLKYPKAHARLIKELELIVIDEISMVRADMIDFIDKVLRVYSGRMREPFGGKQLLLVGDIFQLEPVMTADMRQLLRPFYPCTYFFGARAFSQVNIVSIELRKVYRQNDPRFIDLLDRVRAGAVNAADLAAINARCLPHGITEEADGLTMTLATRRDMVDSINETRLARIESEPTVWKGIITGDFPDHSLPTALELTLKEGAQVVFIKNDPDRRWVNGTLGRVTSLAGHAIEVQVESGQSYIVEPAVWSNIRYTYDEKTRRVIEQEIGSFTQLPLKLAWALTIHKSQGLTFSNVVIDIGRGAFSSGQTYVALSRCTSLEGMTLRSTIAHSDIFVNPMLRQFSTSFNDVASVRSALDNARAREKFIEAASLLEDFAPAEAFQLYMEARTATGTDPLGIPAVARLVRRRLASYDAVKARVEELKLLCHEQKSKLRGLAAEYICMGDECYESGMLSPALANYEKAVSLDETDPANAAILKKIRKLKKSMS